MRKSEFVAKVAEVAGMTQRDTEKESMLLLR